MDQMNLTQVRPGRVACDAGTVFHRLSHMGVTLDAEAGEQSDAVGIRLLHRMRRTDTDRHHEAMYFHQRRLVALS